jgi:hypothetical protein
MCRPVSSSPPQSHDSRRVFFFIILGRIGRTGRPGLTRCSQEVVVYCNVPLDVEPFALNSTRLVFVRKKKGKPWLCFPSGCWHSNVVVGELGWTGWRKTTDLRLFVDTLAQLCLSPVVSSHVAHVLLEVDRTSRQPHTSIASSHTTRQRRDVVKARYPKPDASVK